MADSTRAQLNRNGKEGTLILAEGYLTVRGGQGPAIQCWREGINGSYLVRQAVHTDTKHAGIMTTLDVHDEADGVDFAEQATEGQPFDFSGVPAATVPTTGIGHN